MHRSHTRQGSFPALTLPPPTQPRRSVGVARGDGGPSVGPHCTPGPSGVTARPLQVTPLELELQEDPGEGERTEEEEHTLPPTTTAAFRYFSTPHPQPPPQPPLADQPPLHVCLHFLHEHSIQKPFEISSLELERFS